MQADDEAESRSEEASENLGNQLREAREQKGLSLEAIAAELRIGSQMLEALEECRFDVFDAPVFAKGYLKQYAARLGLDAAAFAAAYDRTVGAAQVQLAPSSTIKLRDDRQIRFWFGAGSALAVIAVILGVWWSLGTDSLPLPGGGRPAPAPPEPSAIGPERSREAPTQEPVNAIAIDSPELATPEVSAPQAAVAERTTATGGAPSARVEPGSADPIGAPPAIGGVDAARVSAELDQAAGPEGPELEVVFHEDSWAEITNADGVRLFYNLGQAGTSARVAAVNELNLFFGNAAGVELFLDGEPVPIPESAIRGDLAQFNLDPASRSNP